MKKVAGLVAIIVATVITGGIRTVPSGAQSNSACPIMTTSSLYVKAKVVKKVFDREHIAAKARKRYSVELVVPPELGGSTAGTPENLTVVRKRDHAARELAAMDAWGLVCQGLVDKKVAGDAFRKDWRTSTQVLQQAAEQRKADVAAFAAAEQQRQVDEYLASIPTTTAAPAQPLVEFGAPCDMPGATAPANGNNVHTAVCVQVHNQGASWRPVR